MCPLVPATHSFSGIKSQFFCLLLWRQHGAPQRVPRSMCFPTLSYFVCTVMHIEFLLNAASSVLPKLRDTTGKRAHRHRHAGAMSPPSFHSCLRETVPSTLPCRVSVLVARTPTPAGRVCPSCPSPLYTDCAFRSTAPSTLLCAYCLTWGVIIKGHFKASFCGPVPSHTYFIPQGPRGHGPVWWSASRGEVISGG